MLGIIPALAGNTRFHAFRCLHIPDHPRSRGEYVPVAQQVRVGLGSSPLSRGILSAGRVLGFQQRIIPALAGNTTELCRHGTVG